MASPVFKVTRTEEKHKFLAELASNSTQSLVYKQWLPQFAKETLYKFFKTQIFNTSIMFFLKSSL